MCIRCRVPSECLPIFTGVGACIFGKEQKRQEEDLANNLRAEKLANMDEEEREAFLEMEKEAEEHKKKQERMLQRQMKAYKKGGKKKKLVGGRGKKKKKGKMQV